LEHARSQLQNIVRQWELCFRLANLDASDRACFHYSIKKCYGACVGEESPEDYNARVELAISQMDKRLSGSFFLLDRGRTEDEIAIVGVQEGVYKGFGYRDAAEGDSTVEDLLESLKAPDFSNPDAARIIHYFMEGKKGLKVIPF
jgi:DNA polymerase-3 subunit epsilon